MEREREREMEMAMETPAAITRKEKRKALKKLKRQQLRRQLAIRAKEQENDPQEQLRLLQLEEEERQRSQRERNLFEESERRWSHKANQLQLQLQLQHHQNKEDHSDKEDHAPWDYVQAGPAQIIWRGNEIILKKTTIQLPKSHAHTTTNDQDAERPISNPLPPQSQPLSSHFHMSTLPTHDVLNKMAQETPNFGTEQDKAHCPFHLKTGVCRFGLRCNRVHLYPEKSCTLLIKNMYSGPGLAWELDEGLECTDEEVEHSYEEFYEDVHTEFLKFGELVNFKVCRNSSYHLRGNVYVHYKSLDSAVFAFESINGRYFAGKQIICDFVSVTRWKVAICGEYMKSRLKSCSRGSVCNFLHCFRNPGGDYEWADWDKPPPKYWINKMISLFGFSDQSYYNNKATELGDVENSRSSDLKRTPSSDRYDSRRKKERHDCHFVSDDSDIERGDRKRRRHTSKSEKHQTHDSDRHHSTRKRSHDERLGSISRKHKERRNREYHTEEGNDITESKRRHQNKEPREVSKGSFSEEEEADVRREKSKRHRDNYSDNVSDNKSRGKHSTSMKRRQRKKHGEDASEEANYDGYANSR